MGVLVKGGGGGGRQRLARKRVRVPGGGAHHQRQGRHTHWYFFSPISSQRKPVLQSPGCVNRRVRSVILLSIVVDCHETEATPLRRTKKGAFFPAADSSRHRNELNLRHKHAAKKLCLLAVKGDTSTSRAGKKCQRTPEQKTSL